MPEPLLQCSYMPGDTFAIAAYLALTPSQKLVFLQDTTLEDNKHTFIRGLYTETGVIGQVTVIDLEAIWKPTLKVSPCKEIYRLWSGNKVPAKPEDFKDTNEKKQAVIRETLKQIFAVDPLKPRAVTAVTGWLAKAVKYSKDHRLSELLMKWKIAALTKAWGKDFDNFLSTKGMTALKSKAVVIWSRQSGKRGGAHLELDSSFTGIEDLVEGFTWEKGDFSIILAGDDKEKNTSTKLQEIAKKYKCYHLGEFWRTPEWKEKFDENRIAQMAFWVYVNATKCKMTHLGMRSGNLEVMSLLGMPAVYLEPKGSGSGDRMTAFKRAGIPYDRLIITEAPGLTGQWVQRLEKTTDRPIKTHDLKREISQVAQQDMRSALTTTYSGLDDLKSKRNTAYSEGRHGEVRRLKGEIEKIHQKAEVVKSTDFTGPAKKRLKERGGKGEDEYPNQRGFYTGDVNAIVEYVLKKMG